MTTNQLKAYELATRNKELEETRRANLVKEAETERSHREDERERNRSNEMNESLKNRENLAKYGTVDYASGEGMLDSSWKVLKSGKDLFSMVFNPLLSVLGGKKK